MAKMPDFVRSDLVGNLDEVQARAQRRAAAAESGATPVGPATPFEQRSLDEMARRTGFDANEFARQYQRKVGIDPDVNYGEDVPHYGLRSGLSLRDSPEEKSQYLNETVGEDGWRVTPGNEIIITPAGLQRLDVQAGDGRNVLVDSPKVVSPHDFTADMAGDIGPIAGATALGVTAPVPGAGIGGFLRGLASAGVRQGTGAAVGRLAQEGAEEVAGINTTEGVGDVATRAAIEGLITGATAGTTVGGSRAAARKALAPFEARMTPQAISDIDEAAKFGIKPSVSTLNQDNSFFARLEGLTQRLFGRDADMAQNEEAITGAMGTFQRRAGADPRGKHTPAGQGVKDALDKAITKFHDEAKARYRVMDEIAGGDEFLDTTPLRHRAQSILAGLMTRGDGKPLRGQLDPAGRAFLEDMMKVKGQLSMEQLHDWRSAVGKALYGGDTKLFPGVPDAALRDIYHAFNDMLDYDYVAEQAAKAGFARGRTRDLLKQLKDVDTWYGAERPKLDNRFIKTLVDDPRQAEGVAPELVAEWIWKGGTQSGARISAFKQLKDALGTRSKHVKYVRRYVMDKLADKMTTLGTDGQPRWTPNAFMKELDRLGPETLTEYFGARAAKELRGLGRAAQLAFLEGRTKGTGALVVNTIALHPIKNLPTIAKLAVIKGIIGSKKGRKWLTTGLLQPQTSPLGRVARPAGHALLHLSHAAAMAGALGESPEDYD